ncbi:MAG: type II toxin-antitoxin system Phd/YefM family antitoxin [Hahellaceae bacterium]|jgi:prevent-host-death family protein|nr:type II toxin-antitoxin system Phd/YefM family antitoxin [Hahellaceae bacterium]MCP5212745.1 type II toxin-antitoxin system Phd/YefM family antitoxin [Hahellaceae bacterium]
MTQANMHEAKSKLSQLADIAHSGEVVVIAKAGKPYVDLVPHQERKVREPGGYEVDMTKFDAVDAEIESDFYGSI